VGSPSTVKAKGGGSKYHKKAARSSQGVGGQRGQQDGAKRAEAAKNWQKRSAERGHGWGGANEKQSAKQEGKS